MTLEEDIKSCVVTGTEVVVRVRYDAGVDHKGIVGEIDGGTFELLGEILNAYEHYSNISAEPKYRKEYIDISDITSIKKAEAKP